MVNTEAFIKRLQRVLAYYDLSASAFADSIAVQRSSISHLLSGRNKPSLEFVLKVVKKYPEVNLYWLLNGKGEFPSLKSGQNLKGAEVTKIKSPTPGRPALRQIILIYEDGSFETLDHFKG